MGDEAGVNIFSLDQEDKLLMIPGINVVVDMEKHELGLTPLMLNQPMLDSCSSISIAD